MPRAARRPTVGSVPPRSLAEDLRLRDDGQLARLFALRPTLLRPVPKSFADLALRANSAPATVLALDDLTQGQLDVLTACCALAVGPRFSVAEVAAGIGGDLAVVSPIVRDLYDRVLLWGSEPDVRVPSAVREALGREPGGLDPTPRADLPAIRAALQVPEAFLTDLDDLSQAARDVLLELAWGPPVLTDPHTAAEDEAHTWLDGRGLIARDDLGTRILPREIALLVRRGQLIRRPALTAPTGAEHAAPELTDDRAGHAADQFVRDTDRLVADIERQSWTRQSSGAIVARDWDRATTRLGLAPERVGLLLATAWAAGWVGDGGDQRLHPATRYVETLDRSVASRWAQLAHRWLDLPMSPVVDPGRVLAGTADRRIAHARALVLTGLQAGAGDALETWLRWFRPRLRLSPQLVAGLLAEAEALGFSAGSAPAAVTRALALPPDAVALAADVTAMLPSLTDQVVLQADLTATSLGPLEPAVERRLAEVADWESGGGATVFRFSADSVRRGLAGGLDPDGVVTWLRDLSATPLPQALEVLISDQARAAPPVSVHPAAAVLRCDRSAAAAILADDSLADLGLHQIAPEVLISGLPAGHVIARLREAGHAVAESGGGLVSVEPSSMVDEPAGPTADRVIRSLRHIEERARPGERPPIDISAGAPHAVRRQLSEAAQHHVRLWLAFADDSGRRLTHLVEPLALVDGDVCAFDVTAAEIRTIPLERVVGAAPTER